MPTNEEKEIKITKWDILKEAIVSYFKDNPKIYTFRKYNLHKYLPVGYKLTSLDRYLSVLTARGVLRYTKNKYTLLGTAKTIMEAQLDMSGRIASQPEHKPIGDFIPQGTKTFRSIRQKSEPKPKESILVDRSPKPPKPSPLLLDERDLLQEQNKVLKMILWWIIFQQPDETIRIPNNAIATMNVNAMKLESSEDNEQNTVFRAILEAAHE